MADTIGDCSCGCGSSEVTFNFASIAASVYRSPLCQNRLAYYYNATKRYKTLTMIRTIVWPGYSGTATIIWDWDHKAGVLRLTSSTNTAAVQATINDLFYLLGETVGSMAMQDAQELGKTNTWFFITADHGNHIATDTIIVSNEDTIGGLPAYLPSIDDALFDGTFGVSGPSGSDPQYMLCCWDSTSGTWIPTAVSFFWSDSNANAWGFWGVRTYTGLINCAYLEELWYGIWGEVDAYTQPGGILTEGRTKVWGMPEADLYCRLDGSITGYNEVSLDPSASSYCGWADTSELSVTTACTSGVVPVSPSFIFSPPDGVSVYARAWNANIDRLTEGENYLTRPFWCLDFNCCTGATADSTTTTADSTTVTADSQ